MPNWEYCTVVHLINRDGWDGFYFPPGTPVKAGGYGKSIMSAQEKIAELGNEGWELVSVTQPYQVETRYHFKRLEK